jgi:putative transcriptional regulator
MPAFLARSLFALAVLLPATLLHAALENPTAEPSGESLAGHILIASPTLRDPNFDHTVVLMVRHNREGAFGIVINRQLGERSFAKILEAIGEKDDTVTGTMRIFSGGPVQTELGFVIHSADYHRPETVDIDGHLALTASRDILRDIIAKRGPEKSLVAFGYAGWAAGQLENELALRGWYTAPEDPKLIFDEDREKVWDTAMAHRTQDL